MTGSQNEACVVHPPEWWQYADLPRVTGSRMVSPEGWWQYTDLPRGWVSGKGVEGKRRPAPEGLAAGRHEQGRSREVYQGIPRLLRLGGLGRALGMSSGERRRIPEVDVPSRSMPAAKLGAGRADPPERGELCAAVVPARYIPPTRTSGGPAPRRHAQQPPDRNSTHLLTPVSPAAQRGDKEGGGASPVPSGWAGSFGGRGTGRDAQQQPHTL